jgi:aryl-alcohol dehydrogenase-like predicted oxidoreductase
MTRLSSFTTTDIRASNPRFMQDARKANKVLVDAIETIAARKGATAAQIALAWLLAQEPWIVPIPGTRRVERLDENLGSLNIQLTSDDLRDIEDATSDIVIQGGRCPEHIERMTNLMRLSGRSLRSPCR